MYWSPEQVVGFLKITRKVFDANGLKHVGLTPGETQSWFRFDVWGYASAIVADREALKNTALLTSHSFTFLDQPASVYYGDFRSTGQDLVQAAKPGMKSWVTSRPWTQDITFLEHIRRDIYECKVSGLIPWALISGANQWMESNGKYSDGSMKSAFSIHADGSFDINKGYYLFKQISRAGQPGMKVAQVVCLDPALGVIAFAPGKTKNPATFIVLNKSDKTKEIKILVNGCGYENYKAFRTSESENYMPVENIGHDQSGVILYSAPALSATTFYGITTSLKE
jgi:O-glycosyl hydrolase